MRRRDSRMFLDAAALIEQDDTGDAKEPRLAGSLGGNAVAVWLQWDGDRHNVWANIYDVGAGWRAAQAIEDRSGEAEAPHVAMSPAGGTAIAAWSQPDDGTLFRVWAKRYQMGWGSEGAILDLDNGWHARAPQVAISESGAAKVLWYEQCRIQKRIRANRFIPNEEPLLERWAGAERIETDTDNAENPVLVGHQGGGAMAAWREADGFGKVNAWASRYDTVLQWQTAEPFGQADAFFIADLRLAVDASRNVMAVWHHVDLVDDGVWANRYVADGSGWGEPEPLEADTGVPSMPEVAMEPAGNAVAVWVQGDGTTQNNMAKRYEYAGGWQAAEAIDQGDGDASRPHVAMDPTGNAMAVWQQSDRFQSNIWSRHYGAGTRRWGEAELVETRDGDASAPRVSMDAEGNAIAVRYQWDETLSHNDIWANRWAPAQ